ncbi:MAG TPA: hypothetical protein PLG60_05920 [Acidimicrobiales bacterium]|nr:hypothetical protein [Acidimicrobiales bacterium]
MIDPRFVYLAAGLSALGAYGYVRDTVRGTTAPNRVTWSLWGVEGVLAALNEVQQHVGLAAIMTLMLGLVPFVVVAASFRNPQGVWSIGPFDVVCGLISLAGLVAWFFVHEATVALVTFVVADQIAALPTLRKSWLVPETESPRVFFLGALNCFITILTLRALTTAGVLFPGCIMVMDFVLAGLIFTRVGPRLRAWRTAVAT